MKLSCKLLLLLNFLFGSCQAQKQAIIADTAELELISSDFEFTEGPAADTEGNVYFTDQPNNRIHKWSVTDNTVSVFMENAGRANGLYFDHDGNLLACADENSELWRISPEKEVSVLVDNFNGKRLNGPNDLWVDPQGGIYFTDPYYQRPYWERTEKEIEEERVYYRSPSGEVKIVASDLEQPNGIIGSPDGKNIYIADIGADKTYVYTITEEGKLTNKKLFTDLGSDGMTLDNQGNVYLTGDGVSIFDKNGQKIQHIEVDRKWTANVTFGGPEHQTLFITAMNSIFSLEMKVKGAN